MVEQVERRLAAVLAADVAGYSRLMGIDEEGTLARLKAIRKSLIDPTIAVHRGRVVKTTGDGALVDSPARSTPCVAPSRSSAAWPAQNAGVRRPRIEFRIGIHLGDIMIDESDIFGDGVNIAARLEGIARPGGICMSEDAYRQIRGKVDMAGEIRRRRSRTSPSRCGSAGRVGLGCREGIARSGPRRSRCPTSRRSPCCRSRT